MEEMNKSAAVAASVEEIKQERYASFKAQVKRRLLSIEQLTTELEAEKQKLKDMEFDG